MAKRPSRSRQTKTSPPSVPEPDLKSLADQAARLAREWGLPDQERQIYEVLVDKERPPESRGGGARVPTWPRKSGLPTLDKAHIEVMRLHGLHQELIDRMAKAYAVAIKAWPEGDAPDLVEGLAERIEDDLLVIDRQRRRTARALGAYQRASGPGIPVDKDEPAKVKRAELHRLVRGLRYARTWLLSAIHQLAYLAVASVLRVRVRPLHLGAAAAVLVAADRARREPWGPDGQTRADLPIDEFPLSAHMKVSTVMFEEAAQDLCKHVRVAQWIRARILREDHEIIDQRFSGEAAEPIEHPDAKETPGELREHATAKERAEKGCAASQRDTVVDVVFEQAINTVNARFGSLPLQELERRAREGTLDVVRDAILSDLIDKHRTKKIPCPACGKGRVRPGDQCSVCGEQLLEDPLSLSDEDVAQQVDKATYKAWEEIRIKIKEEEPRPDERAQRLSKDRRFRMMRKAIEDGADFHSPTDIGRHCKPKQSRQTITNWEKALREFNEL